MNLIRKPDETVAADRGEAGATESTGRALAPRTLQEAALLLLQAIAEQQEQRRRARARYQPPSPP